jgi:uncharacterized tellurite resistance protein B-like protein
MLPIKDQISLLARLSRVDKVIAKEEEKLIHEIGRKHGLSEEEVQEIIESPFEIADLGHLPADEKFEYLVTIIRIMKADRKIRRSEIQFCERVAMKLGYMPGVVADLSARIHSDPNINPDMAALRKTADKQLL